MFQLKVAAVIIIFIGLIVGLSLVNSPLVTKASVGVRLGVSAVLVVFLVAFFVGAVSARTSEISYEPDRRTHEEWTTLFLDPQLRTTQSWQYRFQRWLRQRVYRSHNDRAQQASGEGVRELESQLSKGRELSINSFFMAFSTALTMQEKISLVRLMLCFAELGLLACIDHALAGYNLQQVAVALTFLPVIVSLFLIPIQWVYHNVNAHQGRTIATSILRMAVWLIHMGVLLWVTRSPLLEQSRSVGLAAVILAGLQPLLILWMLIDRQFVWFAQQWKKNPLTYYDLFERPLHEYTGHFFNDIFVLIWHPLRTSWERSRAKLRPRESP